MARTYLFGQPTLVPDIIISQVDVLPTLIDLCGLDGDRQDVTHDFNGPSLMPLMRDQDGAAVASWPDRVLVTDSQRNVYPVKWKQSAVMTSRWRLVNGTKLYDIRADPEQRHDIAAAYDGW